MTFILEYGFYSFEYRLTLHQIQIFAAGFLNLTILLKLLLASRRLIYLKNNRGYLALIIILLILTNLINTYGLPKPVIDFLTRFPQVSPYVFAVQLYLILFICLVFANINCWISKFRGTILKPLILIPITFALIILIGTLLLLLPRAVRSSEEISLIDALFTATSATCVTGLTVQNTGLYFSRLGQLIILFLIQIGGLGIMTFTTFFGLILGREFGLRERAFLGEALNISAWYKVGKLVIKILLFVFLIELIGTVLLYIQFTPYYGPIFHNFYLSLFHSVSAFCNAGFSLFSNSFMDFQNNLGINLTITLLIIIGGLGFPAIFDLLNWFRSKIKKEKKFLTLHSRTVLITTLILIVGGGFLIFIFENSHLNHLSLSDKLLVSYFQSVTTRTAGFSTLSIGNLLPATALILIVLMFIGASPGSTGGGIKTSTLAVIIATLKSWLTGRSSVRLFKRSLVPIVIRQAFTIFSLALLWISLCTLVLSQTEKTNLLDALFEVVSAFGTVGLSRGITANLTTIGKLIIILTMFVGRIGPLTLSIYIAKKGISEPFKYPEDKVIIG
ncbi:MAG: TrkH family potassium uptake protein [Patescibacteria group bacterium]